MGTLPGVAADLVTQGRSEVITVADVAARAGLPAARVLRALLAAGHPGRGRDRGAGRPRLVHGGLRAGRGAHGGGGHPRLHAGARRRRQQCRRGGHRPLLRRAGSGHGAARVPTSWPGPGWPRPPRPPSWRCPTSSPLLVMNAFERAQRRAEAARSWLGSSPPADAALEGPTEVVALGFVDLVGSTAWGQTMSLRDQSLALTRFESAAWTSAVLGRRAGHQDDRRRSLLRRPHGRGRLPDRSRDLPGGRPGRRPAPGPRSGGDRSSPSPGRATTSGRS